MALLARPAPTSGRTLSQLDSLRGVAIVAVFLQHLAQGYAAELIEPAMAHAGPLAPWMLTALHHAWWGVDLFFVLSGFSLALGLLRAETSAVRFWIRRAARVLPAFWVALVVMMAVHPTLTRADGFGTTVIVHLFVLQGYVSTGVVLIPAAWSLTTEAHFYVLMPALVPLLLRGQARRGLAIGLVLCAIVWLTRGALHTAFLEPSVPTAWLEASQRHWIASRLDQFVLGALAAVAFASIERSRLAGWASRIAPVALIASAAALLVSFRLEGALYLEPGGSWPYALMSLSTTALVLACVLTRGHAARIVAPLPLRALGVVSYGVFLYHQLAIEQMGQLLGLGPPTWIRLVLHGSLALGLSAAAGLASWRWVERPAIAWAARRPRRTVEPSRQPAPCHAERA